MRPLETLHNNLCFKNLNNFLTRMINDRHSPYDSAIINPYDSDIINPKATLNTNEIFEFKKK